MKRSRLLILPILVVLAISLAACAPAIPPTLAAVGGLLQAQPAQAKTVAAQPAAAAIPPAQGVVAGDLQSALEKVYGDVNPSVVSIRVRVSTTGRLQQMLPGMPNLPNLPNLPNSPFRFFFGPQSPNTPGTPQEQPQQPQYGQALGSGFVWDTKGHIVTNNHVVDGADQIYVTFADGTTVGAKVVGTDPDSDLAVLQLDSTSGLNLQPIKVGDSIGAKVGQLVIAIGNPFGLENTMTFGIISAIGRSIPVDGGSGLFSGTPSYTIPDVIQTDAAVNPGNSGGVLLDLDGNLLGVPSQIESRSGSNAGVGFAIPAAIVEKVVPVLIDQGKIEHPWIGISGGTLTPELAKAMNLPDTQRGALVSTVTSGSPAEKAGLRGSTQQATINGEQIPVGGDVIVAISGQPVKQFDDLVTYLARDGKVGQQVQLTVLRDGKEMTLSLTLGARPATTSTQQAQPQQQPQQQQPQPQQPQQPQGQVAPGTTWLGIQGATLTAGLAQAMNLNSTQKGVVIESVVTGSPADTADLRGGYKSATVDGQDVMIGGDVITNANGQSIESIDQLVSVVQGMKPGDKLSLTVLRNGDTVNVTATLAARPAAGQ